MGFLDSMLSDLVKNTTGINAKRAIRKIGGKNILLMGGAALAGTLMAEKMQGGSNTFGGGQAPFTPQAPGAQPLPPVPGSQPPLPPLPGSAPQTQASSAPLPPLPAVPAAAQTPPPATPPASGDDATTDELPAELTYPLVRTMVAAALADGQLEPREREIIHRHLGQSDLSADQTAQIHRDLVLPASPAELAELAELDRGPAVAETMYRCATLIIHADEQVDPIELSWLRNLANSLRLDDSRRQQLDDELLRDA